MPSVLNYPGVYVEEIPSGVRTIVGGSTSDTAFVDFFPRGPLNEAVRITSFGDFKRRFGGLDLRSEASYAIQQYYVNGGSVAWVVRVDPGLGDETVGLKTSTVDLLGGSPLQTTLTVSAINPGAWGDNLRVIAQSVPTDSTLFNLIVREVDPKTVKTLPNSTEIDPASGTIVSQEVHRNLSFDTQSANYVERVVNQDSDLIQVTDAGLGEIPQTVTSMLDNGSDGGVFKVDGTFVDSADLADFGTAIVGDSVAKTGLYALTKLNILCLPAIANFDGDNMKAVASAAQAFCQTMMAFLIVDIPASVNSETKMEGWLNTTSIADDHSAVYYPRLLIADALNGGRRRNVGASGTLAGVYARTDAERGTWKAPAGTDATLRGAVALPDVLNDQENGALNPLGVNVLRSLPVFGLVSWGARTLDGSDQAASEWKYIPVRRMALYIEQTLYNSLKWVVFEPNDEPLWAQIRLAVGGFMNTLFRQGAFQGKTPREAYLVKCDSETTTQQDINAGVVNILVGFAPLKPAEFVVVQIQQLAGQVEV